MGETYKLTSKKYITIKICYRNLKYDYLTVNKYSISKIPLEQRLKPLNEDLACGDGNMNSSKVIESVYLDGILAHYLIRELRLSQTYRKIFIGRIQILPDIKEHIIVFKLIPAKKEIVDYDWNYRTIHLAWERVELDHALSWLSTLGGAFSALGDYFSNCAVMAGKISFHQLKLALRLGDPTVASRCKLYFSLSLIQRGYFKIAKKIIQKEYLTAKNAVVVDIRLIKMCLGIWAKLKYEYSRKRLYGK